jgi:hypothetical protein
MSFIACILNVDVICKLSLKSPDSSQVNFSTFCGLLCCVSGIGPDHYEIQCVVDNSTFQAQVSLVMYVNQFLS